MNARCCIFISIMMWDGIDQRKFPRVNYKCRIRVSRDGKEEVIDTFTENIGAGGICVILDRDFGLFEEVALEIFLEDGDRPILCKGAIVWVVKRHPAVKTETVMYDTGVEFLDIADADRDRVDHLVQDILSAET